MSTLDRKLERLRTAIGSAGSVAIAYSGGTDSSFLARVAFDELGRRAVAVTVDSPLLPRKDLAGARRIAKEIGVPHTVLKLDPLKITEFVRNSPDRCYVCKRATMRAVVRHARAHGVATVLDGSNADDARDYRPGTRAKDEAGVRSPLADLGFTKKDIRTASKRLGLSTHDRSANPCLASRISYGEDVTRDKLRMIERAEDYLTARGFKDVRVRLHGTLARIEVSPQDVRRLTSENSRGEISRRLKALGFTHVSVDLEGYRTGSMNEVLDR